MRRLQQILWRYWVVMICTAAITAVDGSAGADVAPPSPSPVINVVAPENPALLVQTRPGQGAVLPV
jgi:hypothetical protein